MKTIAVPPVSGLDSASDPVTSVVILFTVMRYAPDLTDYSLCFTY